MNPLQNVTLRGNQLPAKFTSKNIIREKRKQIVLDQVSPYVYAFYHFIYENVTEINSLTHCNAVCCSLNRLSNMKLFHENSAKYMYRTVNKKKHTQI